MTQSRFRNDIQGLRAVAVLAVMLNHAFPKYITGGYVGVDIFFVISGYLIPQIIVREIEEGDFSLENFYRRRARRILPALLVVVLVSLACGWIFLAPGDYAELSGSAISTLFFVSNFYFSRLTGYFDGAAELKPLLHMWSLAVEEQYYILFPPALYVIWRYLGAQRARLSIWFVAVVALGVSEIGRQISHTASYYLLPTRAIELLVGTLFGIGGIPSLKDDRARHFASMLGLAMMLITILFFNPATPFPGVSTLLPCVGAGLLIYAGKEGESIGGRLLSNRLAVYLGAISYSLYLWHWPILAFLRNLTSSELSIGGSVAAVLVTFGLASLSYRYVEQPFLSERARKLPYLKVLAAGTGILALLSGAIVINNGMPSRFSPAAQHFFVANQDYNPRRDDCQNAAGPWLPYAKSCVFGSVGAKPDLAVWGDSHGGELVAYLGERAAQHGRSVRELTSSACPPAVEIDVPYRPNCKSINVQTLNALVKDPAVRSVVLIANGGMYDDKKGLKAGMRKSVKVLQAAGKRVIVIKQIPSMPYDVAQRSGLFTQIGWSLENLGESREEAYAQASDYDQFVNGLGRRYKAVVYDPKGALCRDGFCHGVYQGASVMYFNTQHLSVSGVRVVFKDLADAIYRQEPLDAGAATAAGGRSADLGAQTLALGEKAQEGRKPDIETSRKRCQRHDRPCAVEY